MHGIRRLSCQKSKRIPLVAARCVLLESAAESASQGGIFRCSAFIFADKNSIVVIGTLIERAVCNTLDELDLIDGLIKDPATTQDKEHNAYLRLMHEYKAEYAKREKCIKVGILLIIISAVVFLALMFSLDSKTFFLTLWIIFIISGIAVMTRIDYRCYKYEKILGIKNTDKEDDLEKMKNDIDKTISNAKTELENAKANIETTIESAKKDISRLCGMKTREQENK